MRRTANLSVKSVLLSLAVGNTSLNETLSAEASGVACGTESVLGCGESDCLDDSCGEPLFGCITPLTGKTLTGDWFGGRPHLADSGVTVDANVAQFYTVAVSGGQESSARYAGHGDYVMNIDGDKALGMKGMFIKRRAEHRFGQSLGGVTGALLPSAVATDLPNPESEQI